MAKKKTLPKTKPIPVRVDGATRARVEKVAAKLGSNSSSIMRLGVLVILPQLESGSLRVPAA